MEMNFFDPRSHNKEKVLIFPSDFRLKQQEWSELAYRSKLCLCPDGDSPNTGRLVEVIMHGCVPLIISNRLQPPFHKDVSRVNRVSGIAFFLREDAIPRLPAILAEQFSGPSGDRRILEKRTLLRQMSHLCDYARDGIGSTLLLALRVRELRGWSDGSNPIANHAGEAIQFRFSTWHGFSPPLGQRLDAWLGPQPKPSPKPLDTETSGISRRKGEV
eukprot:g9303.t1